MSIKPMSKPMTAIQAALVYFTIQENWNRGRGGFTVEYTLRRLNEAECSLPIGSHLHMRINTLKYDIIENNISPAELEADLNVSA